MRNNREDAIPKVEAGEHSTSWPGSPSHGAEEAKPLLNYLRTIGLFGRCGEETGKRLLINRLTGRYILVRRDILLQIVDLLKKLSESPPSQPDS